MNKEVTCCGLCPFFYSYYPIRECWHPIFGGKGISLSENINSYPDWCPLKKESITTYLKQDTDE